METSATYRLLNMCGDGLGDKYAEDLEKNGFSMQVLGKTDTEDLAELFDRLEEQDRIVVCKYLTEKRAQIKAAQAIPEKKDEENIEKEEVEAPSQSEVAPDEKAGDAGGEGSNAPDLEEEENEEKERQEWVQNREGSGGPDMEKEEEFATLKELRDSQSKFVWIKMRKGKHNWARLELQHVYSKSPLIQVADSGPGHEREYEKFQYNEFHWRLEAPKGWKAPSYKELHLKEWDAKRKRAAQKPIPQKRQRANPWQKKKITVQTDVAPEKMKEVVAEMQAALSAFEHSERPKKKRKKFLGDLEKYQLGYPADDKEYNFREDQMEKRCKNLLFYKGLIPSRPDNCTIMDFHEKWFGKYNELEFGHGFIQWLFPIREQGLNSHAHKLYPHELLVMRQSPLIRLRIFKSYKLIIDFFGMELADGSGRIQRKKDFQKNYRNLNQSFHNYLRITRILKCLGEVDMEKYKYPFLVHILSEMFLNNKLKNCKQSCEKFWIPTLYDKRLRNLLVSMFKKIGKKRRDAVKALVQALDEEHCLKHGVQVRIDYLETERGAALNGRIGTLKAQDEKSFRWAVTFSDGASKLILAAHLTRMDDAMEVEEENQEEVEEEEVEARDEPETFDSSKKEEPETFDSSKKKDM